MTTQRGLGSVFADHAKKLAVWAKGRIIPNYDATVWRWDEYGNVIRFDCYGDRSSQWGWEIDHRTPSAIGGLDVFANLRPLHCKVNAALGGILGNILSRR
jgi:hypothetical protein